MAKSFEQIQYLSFDFKRSRMSIALQLFLGLLISYCCYQTLNIWLFLSALLFASIAYLIFLKLPFAQHFEHLDQQDWTLKYAEQEQPARVQIEKILDHQLYILIYFSEKKQRPLLVWQDQVSSLQWKSLKTWAKLQ